MIKEWKFCHIQNSTLKGPTSPPPQKKDYYFTTICWHYKQQYFSTDLTEQHNMTAYIHLIGINQHNTHFEHYIIENVHLE